MGWRDRPVRKDRGRTVPPRRALLRTRMRADGAYWGGAAGRQENPPRVSAEAGKPCLPRVGKSIGRPSQKLRITPKSMSDTDLITRRPRACWRWPGQRSRTDAGQTQPSSRHRSRGCKLLVGVRGCGSCRNSWMLEKIRRLQINAALSCASEQTSDFTRRNVSISAAPSLWIHPTINAGDVLSCD